jgi:hypothetical protein
MPLVAVIAAVHSWYYSRQWAAPLTCVKCHISLSCLHSCSDTARLTCAHSYNHLTHSQSYNNACTCIGDWSRTVVACLQGMPNSMQSSPSLSQQQMSQIISAGGASYKQAQLQPNTIPLSHGKVRPSHQSALYSIKQSVYISCLVDSTRNWVILGTCCDAHAHTLERVTNPATGQSSYWAGTCSTCQN